MFSVITINDTKLDNLSKDDVYSLDKSTIAYCCKLYTPTINNHPIRTHIDHVVLYTSEMKMTAAAYFSNCKELIELYGDNAFDDDTIDLCNYLN